MFMKVLEYMCLLSPKVENRTVCVKQYQKALGREQIVIKEDRPRKLTKVKKRSQRKT